jgi:ABC-type uncharacterized transport system fused permease/ATPase subunit
MYCIGTGSLPFVSQKNTGKSSAKQRLAPNDAELVEVLECVRLGHLMDRCDGLDSYVEWASVLSLGEQQRLAFARLLLSRPQLALMDESTSALDEDNEVIGFLQSCLTLSWEVHNAIRVDMESKWGALVQYANQVVHLSLTYLSHSNLQISLYTALQGAGVTFISVGHRNSLRRFHTHILQFREPNRGSDTCTWTVQRLAESDSPLRR